ncbi:MAG: hypothetical protein COA71_07945 [SAR86 cluster bacterium]|uniref:Uncharacterized protein n=1 Tax=SAR86 cluster bacterium TaxID=2030880 RepID=A0A2A5CD94_9GAMM|nr:MAG: hypothetical protein COA71_07945 [SAR86 cluster bacterium]
MKKIIFLFLLTSMSLTAKETEIWSCQGTTAGGLYWQDGEWKPGEFGTRIYKIELQGLKAVISENNDPPLLLMDCESNTWSWSCSNDAAALELNKANTTAVFMRFFGGIFPEPNSNQKDSIYIEALQCRKF